MCVEERHWLSCRKHAEPVLRWCKTAKARNNRCSKLELKRLDSTQRCRICPDPRVRPAPNQTLPKPAQTRKEPPWVYGIWFPRDRMPPKEPMHAPLFYEPPGIRKVVRKPQRQPPRQPQSNPVQQPPKPCTGHYEPPRVYTPPDSEREGSVAPSFHTPTGAGRDASVPRSVHTTTSSYRDSSVAPSVHKSKGSQRDFSVPPSVHTPPASHRDQSVPPTFYTPAGAHREYSIPPSVHKSKGSQRDWSVEPPPAVPDPPMSAPESCRRDLWIEDRGRSEKRHRGRNRERRY